VYSQAPLLYSLLLSNRSHAAMSKMILPGDQTGLYHLVVAGLPWQCSWAKLKDFVINISDPALNVDYVEVYPGSTDGLVRFTNKEDFNVALGT
jgi:hypothetical protein